MKALFLFTFLFLALFSQGQTLAQLQTALRTPGKAVQAIHGYPASVYQGKCHWVPVTALTVVGDQLTVVETWTGAFGAAQTTLKGTLAQGRVSGEWSSSFSSGTWSYNFSTSTGQWNKPTSMQQTFTEFYFLKFRIVNRADLLDGPYECK